MRAAPGVPHLAVIRVLTPGGPYMVGQALSLAFADSTIGRVAPHAASTDIPAANVPAIEFVPESISAIVVVPADAYACGEVLTLSFLDPALVRIHLSPARQHIDAPTLARNAATAVAGPGVVVRSYWTGEDTRRFVAVVDKLFTIDRLGWYRHSLAMRMLLPNEVLLPNVTAVAEAARQLAALRSAATEALGAPLLAALIPQFNVDAEWLESIEGPALVKALAALRESIAPHVAESIVPVPAPEVPNALTGAIRTEEYHAARSAGADAFLPLLIPECSAHEVLSQRLREYRGALLELFGQTARTAASVRLKQMTLPNHVLDDRLWNLAGALQDAFDERTVA